MALPLDSDGWTIFTPSGSHQEGYLTGPPSSSTTMIIYVSSSTGKNSGDSGFNSSIQGSVAQPYRTLEVGMSRLRAGSPDWMLLLRGDTFTDETLGIGPTNGQFVKYGRSATEPMVFGSYTPSLPTNPNPGLDYGARPIIKTTFQQSAAFCSGGTAFSGGDYCVWTGLDLNAYNSDPNDPNFFGAEQTVSFANTAPTPVVVTFPAGTPATLRHATYGGQAKFIGSDLPNGINAADPTFLGEEPGVGYYLHPVTANTFNLATKTTSSTITGHTTNGSPLVRFYTWYLGTDGDVTNGPVIAGESITSTGNVPGGTTVSSLHTIHSRQGASYTSGSPIVTFDGSTFGVTTGLVAGQYLTAEGGSFSGTFPTGIPTSCIIASVDSLTQITLSANCTATVSGNTIYFGNAITMSANATGTGDVDMFFSPAAGSFVTVTDLGSGTQTARFEGAGGQGAIVLQNPSSYTLCEDLIVRNFTDGVNHNFEVVAGSTNQQVRRCILIDCYAAGLHFFGVLSGYLGEENLVDKCGWREDYPFGYGNRGDKFRHGFYLSSDGGTPSGFAEDLSYNIISNSGSDSQLRCGGQLYRNVWIQNPGGPNCGTPDSAKSYSISEDVHLDPCQTAGFFLEGITGFGASGFSNGNTIIDGVIFSTQSGTTAASIKLPPASAGAGTTTVRNAIVWGWTAIDGNLSNTHNTIESSTVQEPTRDNSMHHYPNPERTVASYMTSLGTGSTTDDFIAKARLQGKGNWDERYTANALVEYIREGFGLELPEVIGGIVVQSGTF